MNVPGGARGSEAQGSWGAVRCHVSVPAGVWISIASDRIRAVVRRPRPTSRPVCSVADNEEHASRMLEDMTVSGAEGTGFGMGGPGGGGVAGAGVTGGGGGARAGGGGLGLGLNNTHGSTSSGGPLSPPLSPMYSSPKGVSPRTNILPSFAWGKTMLKHLKRRPPGGPSGPGALRMSHGAAAMRAGAGVGVGDGGGAMAGGAVGGGGGGIGFWGTGGAGVTGIEGDGVFVYPSAMVQVRDVGADVAEQ